MWLSIPRHKQLWFFQSVLIDFEVVLILLHSTQKSYLIIAAQPKLGLRLSSAKDVNLFIDVYLGQNNFENNILSLDKNISWDALFE